MIDSITQPCLVFHIFSSGILNVHICAENEQAENEAQAILKLVKPELDSISKKLEAPDHG